MMLDSFDSKYEALQTTSKKKKMLLSPFVCACPALLNGDGDDHDCGQGYPILPVPYLVLIE